MVRRDSLHWLSAGVGIFIGVFLVLFYQWVVVPSLLKLKKHLKKNKKKYVRISWIVFWVLCIIGLYIFIDTYEIGGENG